MAVFEMLPITTPISELIMQHCDLNTIEKQMHTLNIPTLRRAALNKVRAGITSLEEVNRAII
jgi:type IV pilus assembly protein PilB